MRLLICAGGTGGGVYPALAVLQALNDLNPSWDEAGAVLWVGGENGMEGEIISRQNIAYRSIPAAGLHGVGLKNLLGNLVKLARGFLEAGRIIREFNPDVLFFTGGYLAVPVAYAGRRIPSLVFLPDIEPGLAIRTIARVVSKIALSVEHSRQYISPGKGVFVSGYPVRSKMLAWTRDQALTALELSPELPVLLVFGGSKGARSINQALEPVLEDLLKEIQVIHITGTLDWDGIKNNQDRLPADLQRKYRVYPFLHEQMGAALRCADLVVSRSGASILGEYPLFELPAILVPYPFAWRYQKTNAQFLIDKGGALLIRDEEIKERLLTEVLLLIRDPQRLEKMRLALRELAKPTAGELIARELLSLAAGAEGGSQG